jgi:hypothetical protein
LGSFFYEVEVDDQAYTDYEQEYQDHEAFSALAGTTLVAGCLLQLLVCFVHIILCNFHIFMKFI